jgi:small subunit ribosomal protein S16
MGKKKQPFYRIVAIDSRASRDGKYLENIGYYNPLPNQIDLNVKTDRALYWLQYGAQPSDTVKSLLRRKGVMFRFDLLKRGKSEEEIEQEFKKWEVLQEERMKRLEAATIQAGKKKKEEKKKPEEDQPKVEKSAGAGDIKKPVEEVDEKIQEQVEEKSQDKVEEQTEEKSEEPVQEQSEEATEQQTEEIKEEPAEAETETEKEEKTAKAEEG